MVPRPELSLLERALDDAIADGKGTTIFVTGEPGIGKSTLLGGFLDACDQRSDSNVLTATGRCIDIDGVSHGYLPWKEVLIELDADRAAGKDIEKKQSFKTIIKTLFDESGSEWIQNIPYIGDISAAILDTAQAIQRVERLDVSTGETRELSFRQRLTHVVKECTGSWMGAIPVVGGLAEAIYTTSKSLAEQKRDAHLTSQEDFFILVMTRLRTLAKDNPVVVFLDDLQWADASSLSLLLYLAKNVHDAPYPLLLIGSFRGEDVRRGRNNPQTGEVERHPLEEKLNVLLRYDACREIALGAFDRSQLEDYVRGRFAGQGFDRRFIDELLHVTGGNVLFVQEMLTTMIERGVIVEHDGVWRLASVPEYSHLPRTVEGVIKERYERLAEELKDILQAAAVEGEEFSFEVLSSILQENRLTLNRKIDKLMNKHALVHRSGLSEQLMRMYEFAHNLVQKYIYYSMEEDFRRDIHRMIASTLKELLGEEGLNHWAARYSLHLGIGEGIINEVRQIIFDRTRALPGSLDALREYLAIQQRLVDDHIAHYRNEEAIDACDHVVALMRINGDDEGAQQQFVAKKAKALTLIGRWSEAEELYRQQLVVYRNIGDRVGESGTLSPLSWLVMRMGRLDEAEGMMREAESIARQIHDRAGVASALGNRGVLHMDRGEYSEAESCFREQGEIARQIGDRRSSATAVGNIGSLFIRRGEYSEALTCYREQEEIMRAIGDRGNVAGAVGNRGHLHLRRGEFSEALACYREQEEIMRQISDRSGLAHALSNLGDVRLHRGEYHEALTCYRECESIMRELGDRNGIGAAIGARADVHLYREEYPEALAGYQEYESIMRELGDRGGIAVAVGNRGVAHANLGQYSEALDCYAEFERIARELGDRGGISQVLYNRGDILLNMGRHSEALVCFAEHEAISHELGDQSGVAAAVGNRGWAHADLGQYSEALACLFKAAELSGQLGDRRLLISWLEEIASVFLACLEFEQLPEFLRDYLPEATNETWRAMALAKARDFGQECAALAEELSLSKDFFAGRVLLARVTAAESATDVALQRLYELLEQADNDEQRADGHYWLWKLGDVENAHQAEALQLYEQLATKTPKYSYRKRIEEIERGS